MADGGASPAARPVVSSRGDAEHLLAAIETTMTDLAALLDREAAEIAGGRIAAGLSGEASKTEVAATYLRGLEAAKANAVALARFAPDLLPVLREAQTRLHDAAERNGAILATAKAVSESLLRSLSDEMARAAAPAVYAAGGRIPPVSRERGPLMVSRLF